MPWLAISTIATSREVADSSSQSGPQDGAVLPIDLDAIGSNS